MRLRNLLSIAIVVGLAACHRAPNVQPAPERAIGDYSYRILVGGTSVAGRFAIEADTVTLEARTHACRQVGPEVSHYPAIYQFRCGGGSTAIDFRVNSSTPGLSTWNAMAPGYKEVVVCAKYEFTDEGKQYCVATKKEMRMEMVRVGGRLEIVQVASTDKP